MCSTEHRRHAVHFPMRRAVTLRCREVVNTSTN
uniref:Uncharacterized protein n=1 Tax=Anguilla anguilla TaxID=7936 RepID=A0A0E9PUL4_ANGAN